MTDPTYVPPWPAYEVDRLVAMHGDGRSFSEIAKALGTHSRSAVAGVVRRLGLPPRPNSAKEYWTPERIEQFRKLWAEGMSTSKIGAVFDRDIKTIQDKARNLGLTRDRVFESIWSAPGFTDRAVALWTAGHSAGEIGKTLGLNRTQVIGKMHRMGLSRHAGRPPVKHGSRVPLTKTALPKPRQPHAVTFDDAEAKRAVFAEAGASRIEAFSEALGANSVSLIQRRPMQCAWPVGPDGQHLCCGDRVAATFRATPTYCARHSRMAVARVQPVRKISTEPSPIRRAA